MARKKKSYRQLIQEEYEYVQSEINYYFENYGIKASKMLQAPHYKESRKRNYEAFVRRASAIMQELNEKEKRLRRIREEEEKWESEDQSDWESDDEIDSEEDDYSHVFDEHQQTQLDVETYERAEEGHIYMSWELALYHNYMTRLYYYQFIPAVRALIDTIEGDDEIQDLIILALSGKNDKLPLPELKKVGYYEEGMDVASKIQAFLNSTTKEQLLDEAYPQVL